MRSVELFYIIYFLSFIDIPSLYNIYKTLSNSSKVKFKPPYGLNKPPLVPFINV